MRIRLRGRDLYIIVGVVAIVVAVMWYFFLFSPEKKKVSDLTAQYQQQEQTLQQTQATIRQFKVYEKTAPQAEADLINLHKVMAAESGIPSFMVGLTQTAQKSGLQIVSIAPQPLAAGVPFTVQPLSVDFDGRYFDLEDYLYRLENYVEYRNQQFLVTGRMFAVVGIAIQKSSLHDFPYIDAKITINGYQWTPVAGAATSATSAGAQ
jgi:Pilus assembly protein, PilO